STWPLTPAMACQNVMSTSPLPLSASAPGADVSFGSTEPPPDDADEQPVAIAAEARSESAHAPRRSVLRTDVPFPLHLTNAADLLHRSGHEAADEPSLAEDHQKQSRNQRDGHPGEDEGLLRAVSVGLQREHGGLQRVHRVVRGRDDQRPEIHVPALQ